MLEEERNEQKALLKKATWIKRGAIAAVAVIVLVAAVVTAMALKGRNKEEEAGVQVVTVSTLENIINVSELSTFTSIYNGIAQVMNEKNPEDVDYYVSYESTVKAGIDFSQVTIDVDHEVQAVKVTLPPVHITEKNVDAKSLNFIFNNNKMDDLGVTEKALKACEADVEAETAQQTAILDMAQQSAVNVVRALTEPFLTQFGYTLTVE